MNLSRILSFLSNSENNLLIFAHLNMWLHCFTLGADVWAGEFVWFGFTFWAYMIALTVFILLYHLFDYRRT